jgi:hypothetical protein
VAARKKKIEIMATPYYNANGMRVVQGTVVPSSSATMNHPNNNAYINNAISQKQQAVYSSNSNYYAANNDTAISPMNIDDNNNANNTPQRGEKQPTACRDSFWAVLFYIHLIAVAFATIKYAPIMASDVASEYANGGANRRLVSLVHNRYLEGDNEEFADLTDLSMSTIYTILAISGAAGLFISTVAMSLMMIVPTAMIKVALIFNLCVTLGVVILAIYVIAWPMIFMASIGFFFTLYYTYVVWKRIPFAASTLVTAITAIKCNMGLSFFAYNNLVLTFLWSIWWSLAFVATSYVLSDCNMGQDGAYCENEINGGLIFLFLISFFWVCQVLKNIVHCTVAGTVGTWWFIPNEAKSCCSSAVISSYYRSITTSFGSICFGSLIVAIIQATREIVNSMRTEENSLLLCLIDCVLGLLEYLAEQFNKVRLNFLK